MMGQLWREFGASIEQERKRRKEKVIQTLEQAGKWAVPARVHAALVSSTFCVWRNVGHWGACISFKCKRAYSLIIIALVLLLWRRQALLLLMQVLACKQLHFRTSSRDCSGGALVLASLQRPTVEHLPGESCARLHA